MVDENGKKVETLTLDEFAKNLELEILVRGRDFVTLDTINVSRPGLQLAGFFKYFDASRVLVLGNAEDEFMKTFTKEKASERYSKLFSYSALPCVVISRGLDAPETLIEQAKAHNCPVLRSKKVTTTLINEISIYLNRLLAPTISIHGVLLDVFGVGILITGHSGVGKSETAMELIKRGHRLVADDSVIVSKVSEKLIGTSPETIRYFMEIRGIGIINVKNMYGSGSVLNEKDIELVMELEDWQANKDYDRIGNENITENILGVELAKHLIPIKPGRNLAIIIEVAARNYRLEQMGYDAAEELINRTFGKK